MNSPVRPTAFALALSITVSFGPAMAQTPDRTVVGVGLAQMPVYPGADDYRTLPLPVIDIVRGPFFANLRNGIGVNVVDGATVTIGGSVTFLPGYRRRDVPEGVGRLSWGAGSRLYASFRTAGLVATLGGTQGFAGGTKGFVADASLAYPVSLSRSFTLIPTISTSWASARHNDRYFGVTAHQSNASGLPEYRPGGGMHDATASFTASYRLNDRVDLNATIGATRLLGDVSDSPIVVHKLRPTGLLALSFRLGS